MYGFAKLTLLFGLLLAPGGPHWAFAGQKKCADVRGMILSEDGTPLKRGAVFLVPEERILRYGIGAETNENGEFTFDGIPAGEYVLAYGPLMNLGRRITVSADDTAHITLKLTTTSTQAVQGDICASVGKITGGIVSFFPLDPDRSRWVWPATVLNAAISESGQYNIAAIEPGCYLVNVRPPSSSPLLPLSESIQNTTEDKRVEEDGTTNFVRIVEIMEGQGKLDLRVPELVLEGIITGPAGQPVENLMLFLSPSLVKSKCVPIQMSAWAVTGKNGVFRFPHVASGSYDLLAEDSKILPARFGVQMMKNVQVYREKTSIDWQLSEPVTVKASIRFSGERQPEYPYIMAVSQEYPNLRSIRDHSFERHDGNPFEPVFLAFPRGRYNVFAMAKEYGYSCEASAVEFTEDTEMNCELAPAGAIRVVLKGRQQDIAGRTVKVLDSSGHEVPRLYDPLWSYDFDLLPAVVLPTCKDGITTIGWLRPGRYELMVEGADVRAVGAVVADETTAIEIKIDN